MKTYDPHRGSRTPDKAGERCTCCDGTGTEVTGDWSQGYPTATCRICKGSGRMERDPKTHLWGPAK